MAKDSFYFSHDNTAFSDPKIVDLRMKHGMEGYGVFWAILELLHQNGGAMQAQCGRIAFALGVDSEIVDSILHEFGLFIFEDDEFYSFRMISDLKDRASRSKKASESANKRWEKANAMRTHNERNANAMQGKERKGKETKGEEKKQKEVFDSGNSEIEIPEKEKTEEPPASNIYELAWAEFREAYPRKEGIERAKNEFFRVVIQGKIPCQTVISAAAAYAKAKAGTAQKFLKLPQNWLMDGGWSEDWAEIARNAASEAAQTPNGSEGKGRLVFDPVKARNDAIAKISAQMAEENKLLKQQNTHNGNAS